MKAVRYTNDAVKALRKHRMEAKAIMDKVARYAETGAGDVVHLKGLSACRLRVGDFRVIFEQTATEIIVLKIGPRGSIYD